MALFRTRDSYLLNNCLAALLSLSLAAEELDHYVCERVVTVVLRLVRKVLRKPSETPASQSSAASVDHVPHSFVSFDR